MQFCSHGACPVIASVETSANPLAPFQPSELLVSFSSLYFGVRTGAKLRRGRAPMTTFLAAVTYGPNLT
jgi:hypothetical protein